MSLASNDTKATFRTIFTSFAAGVGAMLVVGFLAPVVKSGFTLSSADASVLERSAPEIVLDVAAINAKLTEADRVMAASRRSTDRTVARLQNIASSN